MGAPIPINEPQRLQALLELKILDTPPCPQLQAVAQIAAGILGTPIALVSLVDTDRQWFKANVGLAASETCRDYAFCAYAILQSEPLIVEDALQDPRFASNPLVTSGPEIRFYAGVPLTTTKGYNLGTLCVIDSKPRSLPPAHVSVLRMLASLAVQIIETRAQLDTAEAQAANQRSPAERSFAPSLSTFGHEMRTPLTHIIGFADLMKITLPAEGEGSTSRHGEYLDIIRQSGAHLLGLIDNFVGCEENAFEDSLQTTRVDVNAALSEVVRSFARSVDVKQQSLRFVPLDGEAVVLCDSTALRQIAINLIANAAKYCPAGASIDVSVYRCVEEGRICIAIEDDGPGLPSDVRDRLGRPFVRGAKACVSDEDGDGLGLHIIKRLSEAMEASLSFEQGHTGGLRAVLQLRVAGDEAGYETHSVASL
ncbi:HAMP domain-containing histidine kinase [Pelagibius litoralis]|uniref:histidine kinase n=1 Tax=Pelagibius litoralis TaxID=374515 RepID=A0A967EXH5_9PROT|nr:HAMP domain-containing sensor histidine kinase [Pelagibius litoralis]NIA69227.1 HAMP domain-containing histidine kinase [Pelagibius litoralis]